MVIKFKSVEEEFHVVIVSRGEKISITGNTSHVNGAEETIAIAVCN